MNSFQRESRSDVWADSVDIGCIRPVERARDIIVACICRPCVESEPQRYIIAQIWRRR